MLLWRWGRYRHCNVWRCMLYCNTWWRVSKYLLLLLAKMCWEYHESRLSMFRGAAVLRPLRIFRSLAMAEFSVLTDLLLNREQLPSCPVWETNTQGVCPRLHSIPTPNSHLTVTGVFFLKLILELLYSGITLCLFWNKWTLRMPFSFSLYR